MDDLLQQLKTAVECPCCLRVPQPGNSTVGICMSGHMTCKTCGDQVLQEQQSTACPVCRQTPFQLVRGHKLAMTMMDILSAHLTYTCKHERCGQQLLGNALVRHEEQCSQKPVACPRTSCIFLGPIHHFQSGLHARCVSLSSLNVETQTWNIILDMSLIYSFDVCDISISDRFKPIILKGTILPEDFVSHAYLNIIKMSGMAVIFLGWMNVKQHLDEKFQNAKFYLSVYINTRYGRVGQFVKKGLLFEKEHFDRYENGIYLNKHAVFNWADWIRDFKCNECNAKKGHPHIHIEIKKE